MGRTGKGSLKRSRFSQGNIFGGTPQKVPEGKVPTGHKEDIDLNDFDGVETVINNKHRRIPCDVAARIMDSETQFQDICGLVN